MIENDLVHFIASDAHHDTNRPFILNSLFKEKKLSKFEENLKELIQNAQVILNNQDLKKKQPTQNYNQKKLFGLF